MSPDSVAHGLRDAFAPLDCQVDVFDAGHLGLRLRDSAGRESAEYLVELSRIRTGADLDEEVGRILGAIEIDGFHRPAAGRQPPRAAPSLYGLFRTTLRRFLAPA